MAIDAKFIQSTQEVQERVNGILMTPKTTKMWKVNEIFRVVEEWMLEHGRFYSIGKENGSGMAVWLDNETREVIEISSGGSRFSYMLQLFGIQPSTNESKDIGKNIGTKFGAKAPANTIYAMSTMKDDALYLNQYDGTMLKITVVKEVTPGVPDMVFDPNPEPRVRFVGKVEKLRNGDDDVLFNRSGDPLDCDIEKANGSYSDGKGRGLNLGGNSLIEKYLLSTVSFAYDENAMDEDTLAEKQGEAAIWGSQAKHLLCGMILALYFQEMIRTQFMVLVTGVPGTMKSSLIRSVGKVIIGKDFNVTPFPKNPDDLVLSAITSGFLGFDETNLTKEHEELLNTISTGGMDSRRELYTTDKMRRKPFQARIWMTGNATETRQESTSSRVFPVDVVRSGVKDAYRADDDVERELLANRDAIWTEIVTRCQNIMAHLASSRERGDWISHVDHRMSSFAVWYLNCARSEGWLDFARTELAALQKRQQMQVTDSSSFLDLIDAYMKRSDGLWRTAAKWSRFLDCFVNENDTELRRAVARSGYVANRFKVFESTLKQKYGMKTRRDGHLKHLEYMFPANSCGGAVSPQSTSAGMQTTDYVGDDD